MSDHNININFIGGDGQSSDRPQSETYKVLSENFAKLTASLSKLEAVITNNNKLNEKNLKENTVNNKKLKQQENIETLKFKEMLRRERRILQEHEIYIKKQDKLEQLKFKELAKREKQQEHFNSVREQRLQQKQDKLEQLKFKELAKREKQQEHFNNVREQRLQQRQNKIHQLKFKELVKHEKQQEHFNNVREQKLQQRHDKLEQLKFKELVKREKQQEHFDNSREQKLQQRQNKIHQQNRNFGMGILAGVGYTGLQYLENQNQATMSKAVATGSFLGSNIQGKGAGNFGSYVGSLYNIEKNRKIAERNILASGVGRVVGGTVGFITGDVAGATAGAYAGSKLGQSFVTNGNAEIEQRIAIMQALSERRANSSIEQYKSGFSRFGLGKSNYDVVPKGFTANGKGINVPLSSAFEDMYGTVGGKKDGLPNQNYNDILGITPYLQSNPTDKSDEGVGDLNQVVNNFKKAGFAAQDFAQLTLQSTKYQALSGKNVQSFSDYILKARQKFGNAFSLDTSNATLNLMALGYNDTQAQNINFQSQNNQGIMSGVGKFQHQSINDWWSNKIIGDSLGIDINESNRTGQFVGSAKAEAQLLKERNAIMNDKAEPLSQPMYAMLRGSNSWDLAEISSKLQNKTKTLENANQEKAGVSPEVQTYTDTMQNLIQNGIINTEQMNVTASSVVINSNELNNMMNKGNSYASQTMSPYGGGNNPAKK